MDIIVQYRFSLQLLINRMQIDIAFWYVHLYCCGKQWKSERELIIMLYWPLSQVVLELLLPMGQPPAEHRILL